MHGKAGYGDMWIGLTDREFAAPPNVDGDGDPTPQEAGTSGAKGWAWTSGEAVTFAAFGGGEPNDSGGEDAAHIRGDGLWNDHKSGWGLDEPLPPMLQAGTSTDETAAPTFKYVIEYPKASATEIAGIDAAPPTLLPASPMPGPSGGAGYWGIREVRDVDPGGSIGSTISNLLAGSGTIYDGTAPILDSTDPDTNGSGGPILDGTPMPFLSDTAGVGDDNIMVSAKGRIKVVEPGDYTLQVRSDDGFALKVNGASFSSVSGGGALDRFDPSTMLFAAGTGDSNTRGIINLAAGEYDVEFVWWEGGGGAYYEVTSAQGAPTGPPHNGCRWVRLTRWTRFRVPFVCSVRHWPSTVRMRTIFQQPLRTLKVPCLIRRHRGIFRTKSRSPAVKCPTVAVTITLPACLGTSWSTTVTMFLAKRSS